MCLMAFQFFISYAGITFCLLHRLLLWSPSNHQVEPGGATRSQEEPREARRSQEEPGGARRSQEEPRGGRRSHEEAGGARRSQEEPGDFNFQVFHFQMFRIPLAARISDYAREVIENACFDP